MDAPVRWRARALLGLALACSPIAAAGATFRPLMRHSTSLALARRPSAARRWPRVGVERAVCLRVAPNVAMAGSSQERPELGWARHVPNALSLSRIAFIPIVCTIWLSPLPLRAVWCSSLFGIAMLTDLFDGLVARKLGVVTRFGAFLDPVTDKLLVCSCLVLLASTYRSVVFTAAAIVAVSREIAVSALREWMAQCGKRDDVQVGTLGKWKTASQLAAIWLFFALPALPPAAVWGEHVRTVANVLLCTSTVLSLLSMYIYFRTASASLFGPVDQSS